MTVTGTVVDELGEPLLGAGIVVKDTTTGTTADLDGNFVLTVPEGSVLQFISVGFQTVEITVGPNGNLGTITMKTETTLLDQVVVVGYGSQKKVDLTGSVAIVDADEMKKVSHSNISSMLEGKVAGVQITSDGQPGADPAVRIRGIGSFGDTSPLYVIDGVPMGTTIRDFSPNDIETIQVLKDASAAAIYGSRAANGVVIITTKNGKKNQPIRVEYRGYAGVDQIRKGVYDVMDAAQYGDYIRMSYENNGLGDKVPAGYVKGSENYLDPATNNTDWFKEMFKTGIRQNHNVNLSGGGESSTFNVGLDYFSQKGTLVGAGPNFDRFTARVNNTMDVKFVKLRTGIVYSHSDQDNMSSSNANEYVQGLYGTQYPIMATTLFIPPTIKAYDASTWFLDRVVGAASDYSYDAYGFGTYYDSVHGDIRIANPLLYNTLIQRKSTVDRVVATGSATVDLLGMVGVKSDNHKLDYNLNLSYSRSFVKGFTFLPAFILSNANYLAKSNERLSENYNNYSDFLVENYLTYDGKMGNHHLNTVVGMTFQRERYHTLAGWGNNLPEPYYLQVGNATDRDASSYESEHVLASLIGRINYDYDSRYLFQATVRRDGSSRLSVNRYDWFPSFSVGWRVDKEPFFSVDPQLVSLLKFRASYGILGNENIGDYAFMDTMARGNYTYSFGGQKVTGSAISNYVNEFIRWEKKKSLDIGMDYSMFGGAFEFNVDYYRNVSEDLLYSVPVPAEAGATNGSVTMNAATMVNSGVELSASYRNYSREFKYDLSGNVTFPKNVVTSLGMGTVSRDDAMCRTVVGPVRDRPPHQRERRLRDPERRPSRRRGLPRHQQRRPDHGRRPHLPRQRHAQGHLRPERPLRVQEHRPHPVHLRRRGPQARGLCGPGPAQLLRHQQQERGPRERLDAGESEHHRAARREQRRRHREQRLLQLPLPAERRLLEDRERRTRLQLPVEVVRGRVPFQRPRLSVGPEPLHPHRLPRLQHRLRRRRLHPGLQLLLVSGPGHLHAGREPVLLNA